MNSKFKGREGNYCPVLRAFLGSYKGREKNVQCPIRLFVVGWNGN
jgi:hypothetical protein